jgi:hypothetical protein
VNDGSRYAFFVEQELKAERDRRQILDGRGQAVVTTSAALVALLGAVGAVVIDRNGFVLPQVARYPLLSALVLFVVATFGILATVNFKYEVASKETLAELRAHLGDCDEVALASILTTNVTTIVTLRSGNHKKATRLLVALFAQLGALLSLAATVFLAVTAG